MALIIVLEMLFPLSSHLQLLEACKKKNADVNHLSELCSAAEHESGGAMKLGTKQLAKRKTERRVFQFFARGLPKVTWLYLPLVMNRKKNSGPSAMQ